MTTSTLIRRILSGGAGLVLGTSGLAFAAGAGMPLPDQAAEEAVIATTSAPSATETAGTDEGPPDGIPPSVAEENQKAAEARHGAAMDFVGQIQKWTRCIQANARPDSDEEAAGRDDSFDPKVGCEGDAPTTTPGGEAFDPYAPDESEARGESGPPDGVGGPPDGAGPPDWVGSGGPPDWVGGGGPPEGAGPPRTADDD